MLNNKKVAHPRNKDKLLDPKVVETLHYECHVGLS